MKNSNETTLKNQCWKCSAEIEHGEETVAHEPNAEPPGIVYLCKKHAAESLERILDCDAPIDGKASRGLLNDDGEVITGEQS